MGDLVEIVFAFIFFILMIVFLIAWINIRGKYHELLGQIEARALYLFESWRNSYEEEIRQDAIRRSQAVLLGKITEHFIPYLPMFKYNPKDARFIGSPIDFIVFDGLSEGEIRKIVLVEVKAGKSAQLTRRERQIANAIKNKAVDFEMVTLPESQ